MIFYSISKWLFTFFKNKKLYGLQYYHTKDGHHSDSIWLNVVENAAGFIL